MKDTRRKRISLTVEAEPYEDLRRLGDLAGFNPDWISLELNRMIKAFYDLSPNRPLKIQKQSGK